ncbi:MAG: transglycosylase domain-containing protein [Kiloniellaceae bacterium]
MEEHSSVVPRRTALRVASRRPRRREPFGPRWRFVAGGGSALLFLVAAASLAILEAKTSALQSEFFSRAAREMTFRVEGGPSEAILFPEDGPYDRRLGYVDLPGFAAALRDDGYRVETQARVAEPFVRYFRQTGIAPYLAKSQAGLTILGRDGLAIFESRHPQRAYAGFDAVPPLVVESLLFIENRELLHASSPRVNPAVEWDRLAAVSADLLRRQILREGNGPGGSTLATQMEKFRHSPDGRTADVAEKLRQMVSASMRSYLQGQDTRAARQRIVVDYLNSTPLAARAGFGEIIGVGDGLWAWFAADFDDVNRSLAAPAAGGEDLQRRALAYRQLLSLLVAQRRPSDFLLTNRPALHRLVDSYLRLLAEAGIIDTALRDAALAQPPRFADSAPAAAPPAAPLSWKAATTLRARLLGQLRLESSYDLDRLDLTVETALDKEVQERVTEVLRSLSDPDALRARGLAAPRLLDRGAPEKVIYSLVLYESGGDRNHLRLQADNFDGPFDINEGTKLDLGSTAKLRTLVTYLQVVADLYDRLRGLSPEDLRATAAAADPLSRWVAASLAAEAGLDLPALLEAAMRRRYSASPHERFFTGGGSHRFANFDKLDDGKVISVAEAFRNSVNLVFIRLMRDIVAYHVAEVAAAGGNPLDAASPRRQEYLARFADREGREFLLGFYRRYRDLDRAQILAEAAGRARRTPAALAVVYRSLHPGAGVESMAEFIRDVLPGRALGAAEARKLFDAYARERYSLNDRGYLARLHPLELWLAEYLSEAPHAAFGEVADAGAEARQEAYAWLFKPGRKAAQNRRIRTLLEEEAFRRIAASWQRVGYPFDWLVPSYASSIGSSGDRPAALADLIGIIVNDGMRLPTGRFERFRFAEGTPFETVMTLEEMTGERVMRPEVARTLRVALVDTVENGTARRVNGAFRGQDGAPLVVGGKTGTGDHRYKRVGRGGDVIGSTVMNRTATFVFFLGERHFGVVSAHVAGSDAAAYGFTSALPTQLLTSLAPILQPMLDRAPSLHPEPELVAPGPFTPDPFTPEPVAPEMPPVAKGEETPLAGRAGESCTRTEEGRLRCSLAAVLQAASRDVETDPVR